MKMERGRFSDFSILNKVNFYTFPKNRSGNSQNTDRKWTFPVPSAEQAEFYGQFWETAQSSGDFLDVFEAAVYQPCNT